MAYFSFCHFIYSLSISVSPRVSLDIIDFYRPPRGNPIEFNNKLHQMIFDNNSIKTMILGDLNLNLLNLNDSHTVDLLNNMQSLSYRPLINKPTRSTMNSATCINHIWTNNSSNHISGVFEYIQITDHNPIFASVKLNSSNLVEHKTFRNNSLQNLSRLDYEMSLFTNRFYSQFNNNNVNESIYNFEHAFYQSYDQCCPIQTKQVSQNTLNKPWITPDIVLLIKLKHVLFRRHKQRIVPFHIYNEHKNYVTRRLKQCK